MRKWRQCSDILKYSLCVVFVSAGEMLGLTLEVLHEYLMENETFLLLLAIHSPC